MSHDWTAPGKVLREWREAREMSVETAAILCLMCEGCYRAIEDGTQPITEKIAGCLSIGTGIRGVLWLALDKVYRELGDER